MPRQRPCRGLVWEEQGPKGKGHTFESCRVRHKSRCRACRDCGGSISRGGRALRLIRPPGVLRYGESAFSCQLFLRHFIRVRQVRELNARDNRTGISAHHNDDDTYDNGHCCLLFVGDRLTRICFRSLRKIGFQAVQRLSKQFVCEVLACNVKWAKPR